MKSLDLRKNYSENVTPSKVSEESDSVNLSNTNKSATGTFQSKKSEVQNGLVGRKTIIGEKLKLMNDNDNKSQSTINLPMMYEAHQLQGKPSRMSYAGSIANNTNKQSFIDKQYDAPQSLEMFMMETRSRRVI